MKAKIHVLNENGDTAAVWDVTDQISTEEANRVFDEMVKANKMLAYSVTPETGAREVIRDFDPHAAVIVVSPQFAGG